MRVNVRELHRRTGFVVDRVASGDVVVVPARHLEIIKRLSRFRDDSGKFISESRDRS
jgi:antitoxin (DNA-binding transcriptional repressor) of toxin-antitoxin stability system